jgi:hypothetical protein
MAFIPVRIREFRDGAGDIGSFIDETVALPGRSATTLGGRAAVYSHNSQS